MSDEKLKPCPFCGNMIVLTVLDFGKQALPWKIHCTNCGGGTGYYQTKRKAVAAWNRHAADNDSERVTK